MINNQQKLTRLAQVAKQQFLDRSPLLIIVQDVRAAEFVDKILWSYPVDSLTPHEFTLKDCKETICITLPSYNPNKARHIFNLTKSPILEGDFEIVYELDDTSSPEKASISKEKYHLYKESKFALASF